MDEAEQLCDRLVVMDAGLIVAEGSPAELIERYSTREVLELRFTPEDGPEASALEHLAERVEELPDRLLLYTGDGEHVHAQVLARAIGPLSAMVRRSLTGGRVPPAHGAEPRSNERRRMAAIAPGRVRGVLLVIEHFWTWYRRNWRATAVSSVLQPVLFLVAFGVGFGTLVAGRPGAAAATGGVALPRSGSRPPCWRCRPCRAARGVVLPGVLGLQVAAHLPRDDGRADHRRRRSAIATSPGWRSSSTLTGSVFVVVAALVGGVASARGSSGALAAAVLTGTGVTALSPRTRPPSSSTRGSNVIFRLVVVPITLFSGTFFPIDQLPAVVQPLAWISPLWHGTELGRAAALDRWQALPALGHLASRWRCWHWGW